MRMLILQVHVQASGQTPSCTIKVGNLPFFMDIFLVTALARRSLQVSKWPLDVGHLTCVNKVSENRPGKNPSQRGLSRKHTRLLELPRLAEASRPFGGAALVTWIFNSMAACWCETCRSRKRAGHRHTGRLRATVWSALALALTVAFAFPESAGQGSTLVYPGHAPPGPLRGGASRKTGRAAGTGVSGGPFPPARSSA